MKKRDIKTWVTALRSGEYAQCANSLHLHDGAEYRYCCLGVMVEELYDGEWIKGAKGRWGIDGEYGMPSMDILEKIGLHEAMADELVDLNDGGHSFNEIADFIEAHLDDFLAMG